MPRFDPHPDRRPVIISGASSGYGSASATTSAGVLAWRSSSASRGPTLTAAATASASSFPALASASSSAAACSALSGGR